MVRSNFIIKCYYCLDRTVYSSPISGVVDLGDCGLTRDLIFPN